MLIILTFIYLLFQNEENVARTTVISTTTKNLIVSYSDSSFQDSDDSENQQLAHQKTINLPDKETDFEAIVSPEQHNILKEVSVSIFKYKKSYNLVL